MLRAAVGIRRRHIRDCANGGTPGNRGKHRNDAGFPSCGATGLASGAAGRQPAGLAERRKARTARTRLLSVSVASSRSLVKILVTWASTVRGER